MNSTCPYAHVSYATWRLHTFRRLFSDVRSRGQLHPRPPLSRPATIFGPSRSRSFHASPARSRNWKKDLKRGAEHKVKKLQAHRSRTEDGLAQSKNDEEWNPYTESALAELQDMVQSLHQHARETKTSDHSGDGGVPFEPGAILYRKKDKNQPESPLERKLPWERPTKLRVHEVEVDRKLEKNPWAQILASPVRLDRGTRARLPRDLMNTWGIMKNPKDKRDYLMPIELSDMNGLRQELQQTPVGEHQARSEEDENPGGFRQSTNIHPGKRSQISPNRLLIEAITDVLVTVKPLSKDGEVSTKTSSPKLASSLLLLRWRLRRNEMVAFAKTREYFNQVMKREPDEDEPNLADSANLDKLQWHFQIAERMEKMMRERIAIALEAVGRDNASGRAVHDRRVLAMGIPDDGRFDLDTRGRIIENTGNQPKNKHEGNQGSAPDWLSGAIFLHIGKARDYRETVERWHRISLAGQSSSQQLSALPSSDLIPPMITIDNQYRLPVFNLETLFGPSNVSKLHATIAQHKILTLEFWTQLSAQTQRQNESSTSPASPSTPSNVTPSLLTAGESVLTSLATPSNNSILSPSNTQKTPSGHLILLKPGAHHVGVLAREIWQLWRFIGGRPGLYF